MRRLDPRAQLAWLAAAVALVLLGREVGLAVATVLGAGGVAGTRGWRTWSRLVIGLAPLLAVLVALDALGGGLWTGLYVAARIVVLATVGHAFAQVADAERLVAGLRALRVPYPVTFVLVAGARFVPTTVADLVDLRDAARLRGVATEGSVLKRLRGWGVLLVPLLVGTIRRGLQLGEAMEARAFGAVAQRTVRHQLNWQLRDTLALFAALLLVLAVFAWPLVPPSFAPW